MTLDQYKQCPCGSGKKIKFCCSKDLISELDRVLRMIQGDQRLAALEKLESLLKKYPDRPSLLMMRADVELDLKETDKVRQTVQKLAEVNPTNPSVAAVQSMLVIVDGRSIGEAIHHLQVAYNLCDRDIPIRVHEATVLLAQILLRLGYIVAAKGHFQLALSLGGTDDEQTVRSLMQLNHARQFPLLLREPLALLPAPEGVTWRIEFDATMREIFRGRWRRGAEQLSMMAIRILDEPSILFNQAVVYAWLGYNPKAVKALHDFARIRAVPVHERVDAMALAWLLDDANDDNTVPQVRVTYEIDDNFDALMEQCLAHRLTKQHELDPSSVAEGEPMPRGVFEVADRPKPDKAPDEIQPDDIPSMIGLITLFGKETDRPARLVLNCAQTRLDELAKFCEQLLGSELGEPAATDQVGRLSWDEGHLLKLWRIPQEVPYDRRNQLLGELRRNAVRQQWPTLPNPALDGKSPQEAAAEGNTYQITVLALLLNLELRAQDEQWADDFNDIRSQLDLPRREPIDPATVDLERIPIHHLSLIDPSSLSDDQLRTVYRRAYSVMAVHPLRAIAREVVGRKSLDDRVDKVEAYDILSDVARTTDEALVFLEEARKLATAEGESPAAWLIDEMELRLVRGEAEEFVHLLKEVNTRYMKEPGIATALMSTLSRYGLVTPDGRFRLPVQPDTQSKPAPAAQESGLWTPDSGSPPSSDSSAEGKSESKLWIPD